MKGYNAVKISIAVMIMATLFSSSPLWGHPGFGFKGGLFRIRLLQELQLTDDQRAQLKSIFANDRETVRALRRDLWEKRKALSEVTRAEPFDEGKVGSYAHEVGNAQAKLMVARARLIHKAISVLTPEQKAKLNELREERRQRFKDWLDRI